MATLCPHPPSFQRFLVHLKLPDPCFHSTGRGCPSTSHRISQAKDTTNPVPPFPQPCPLSQHHRCPTQLKSSQHKTKLFPSPFESSKEKARFHQGATRGEVSGGNCSSSLRRRNPPGKEDLNSMCPTGKGREDPAVPLCLHPKLCAGRDKPSAELKGPVPPNRRGWSCPGPCWGNTCRNQLDAGMPHGPGTDWAGARSAAGSHQLCPPSHYSPSTFPPVHSYQRPLATSVFTMGFEVA